MAFQPMPLSRKPAPFDHPEWVFELKYDGFRSLAVIQNGRTELISATVIRSTRSTRFGKQ
jgi:bifunctional non-homologous end joining protein LigD